MHSPRTFLLAVATLITTAAADVSQNVLDTSENFTIAMVRSAPPNWPMPLTTYNWTGVQLNISETVDYGIELISKASKEGAGLISFPELWFPGFPKGNAENDWTVHYLPMYINNTLVLGDHNWKRLIAATQEAGIYAGLSFAELSGYRLYMSQALISPVGDLLIHRHKLRPSGSERWFFSDGTVDGLKVVTTPRGRMGMLECGEHTYPSMTFVMQAQMENIHLAPYPYLADPDDESALWWEDVTFDQAPTRAYAVYSGAYTFFHAIGAAKAFDPLGNTIAEMTASADMQQYPMLYSSINTTSFNTTRTFNSDGQQSWGVLQQILQAFPAYIPRVQGILVEHREHSVDWLLNGSLTSELGATLNYGG
ncbi:aliphatic nitrilase-like protein [Aureobasidium pullulans]|nr:aliphatic nitrilase-like protein [Aureobasidium pullulans]